MELRRYLQVSRRWWWAVALAFITTAAVTASTVAFQAPTYKSSATFVVRPRPVEASEDARAFEALIRGVTINTTYASIARSELVRDRAERQLEPDARQDDMSVSAKVLTDTNIVSIDVTGPDPEHVLAMANAVSAETVEYVNGLSDVYVLQPLDEPTLPESPVATNRMLTISIGILLGLVVGVGLAMLVEYLHAGPTEPAPESTLRAGPPMPRRRDVKTSTGADRAEGLGPSPDARSAAGAARRDGGPDHPG